LARNLSRQCRLQKKYSCPPWLNDPAAIAGSTVIPQTGSMCEPLALSAPQHDDAFPI
jgi:hypothetical protein